MAVVPGFDYDIFVSYAHTDDLVDAAEGPGGWVFRLVNLLERLSAKNDFVRALQGRTVFQAKPGQLKNIYTDLTLVDFKDSGDELRYYTDIIDALKETLSAFPKAVSFSYIAADASVHVGELLANSPEKASGAEPYLSESRAWFDRQGLMTKTSTYSEDFTQYCKIYKTRIKMYGAMHHPDLALQDINTVMTTCQAVLDKYPWDIYLRYQIILSNYEAGKALFDAHRFKEALPYLNYASHWGDKQSTQLLAKLYREGLGIDKGDKRALELDALAAGQILTSYTVQADFNGVQQPTKFYIRDWPSEYPYEGIDDQAIWLKEARGATFPPDVIDSFHKLVKIAKDNKVSFRELTEYALKSTDDKAERAKPAPVKRTGPNERARPQYDLALGFGKQEKWPEAAKALEGALVLDPESADILELAVGLYHDKLFLYKRAFELNARLVDLGTGAGDDDFVESHLTTSRFESCTVLSAIDRDKSPEKSRKLVMMALNFACLFGEKKYGAALSAGRKLRADLGGLERVGWNFAGTKHFLGEDKAFAKKSTDWVSLFEALEEGDEKKAQAALTALGVPEAGK
ncbi:DUF2610 domain-containing protein [Granulicella aggregans]|uniref:DUF2610 domain-containing protein n=1 Tax=Granulicella aggregans TaxID=474949 RepID=UPI0021DF9A6A|nr:DUF2610 domain-containing protein [Granulicella aggregans]